MAIPAGVTLTIDPRTVVLADPADAAATEAWPWSDTRNRADDPVLSDPYALIPELAQLAGSPTRWADSVSVLPDDGHLEPVDHIGGVGPSDPLITAPWVFLGKN